MIKLLLLILLLPIDVLGDKHNLWLIEDEIVNCTIEIAKQYFDKDVPVVIHFASLSQNNDTRIKINCQDHRELLSFNSAII